MSRFRLAVHSAASSYLALVAGGCFALLSIPLALHYLSKDRFALWALMASVNGYLSLLDLGMTASVSRLLMDHKDNRADRSYGSFIITGWLVLATQATVVLCVGYLLAPAVGGLLDIPSDLMGEFVSLMRWQAVLLALAFILRMFSQLLYAHQRVDICNYTQVAGLAVNLGILWWLFHLGCGVFSLIWAAMIAYCATSAAMAAACGKLGLFPARGLWGGPCLRHFKELSAFGLDLFLMALGSQLILISQTMIITRRLGLEVAALWAVGTKAYNLLVQLIWRTADAPTPALTELLVRGEKERLLDRYRTLVMLIGSFAVFCAVACALCNSSFVSFWTARRFSWSPVNDLLLGGCLLSFGLVRCHTWFIAGTKQIGRMPYVFFVEGAVFISLALLVARTWRLPGIIAVSLACSIAFTGAYGIVRVARFFQVSVREVAWGWLLPARKLGWRFALVALGAWAITNSLAPTPRFFACGLVCATAGGLLLARYGLPPNLQSELLARLPRPAGGLLSRVFSVHLPSKPTVIFPGAPKP